MCRPGWSGGLPLAADLHCDRNNRSGRGTPSHHPGQVARRAGRDKATGRLRGSVARSRFHRSVAVQAYLRAAARRYHARYALSAGFVNGENVDIGAISKALKPGGKRAGSAYRFQMRAQRQRYRREHDPRRQGPKRLRRAGEQLITGGQCRKMNGPISTVGEAAGRKPIRGRGHGCKPDG
jgi:hypothetical protein